MTTPIRLRLLPEGDFTAAEAEASLRRLREELIEIGVAEVTYGTCAAPRGSKAMTLDFQTIILSLAASGGVITNVIQAIQNWMTSSRAEKFVVEIAGDKIEISHASVAERRQLVKAFIQKHATADEN